MCMYLSRETMYRWTKYYLEILLSSDCYLSFIAKAVFSELVWLLAQILRNGGFMAYKDAWRSNLIVLIFSTSVQLHGGDLYM